MPKPPIFDELCSLCRGIFSDPHALPGSKVTTTWRYHGVRQLIDSANKGCHFCSIIFANTDNVILSKLRHRGLLQSRHRNGQALTLQMEPAWRATPSRWVRLWCEAIPGHEDSLERTTTSLLKRSVTLLVNSSSCVIDSSVFAKSTSRHLLSARNVLDRSTFPSTMNEDSLNTIRKWISYCEKAHPRCTQKIKSNSSRLPGRLLDVECYTREGKGLRLVKTESLPSNTRYITLSHRWSKPKPTQLLEQNEALFHEHIPISQLSKTFTDAMKLTRSLGIKYLWIDSLCIIQDSEEDRNEQIMLMSEIYAKSMLNIAAISASEGIEGLNHPRDPLAIFPCTIRSIWERAENEDMICYDANAWQEFNAGSLLNSRGWVVQERLLAPKTVSFAVDQVYWECASLHASESFPFGLPLVGSDTDWGKNMKSLLEPRTKDQIGADIDVRQFMENWAAILTIYTASALTYESDRFRALSGVTNQLAMNFEIAADSGYIAGFWRFGLEYQLLWSATTTYGTLRNANSMPPWSWTSNGVLKFAHVPSWSWASYEGPLQFKLFGSDNLSLISILSLGCADVACNSFFLRVQGYLCNVSSILTGIEPVVTASDDCDSWYPEQSGERGRLSSEEFKVPTSAEGRIAQLEYVLLIQQPKNRARRADGISCLMLELTG